MIQVGKTLWNRRIAMRDGVEVAADVVLPPGEGPWPALVNRTPYMRGHNLTPDSWMQLVDKGYAFVAVDVRGRGDSDGDFTPFVHDADDGHDVIEWVAAQPWCTGRVGMVGVSYEALTQWWSAKGTPEHLRCIVPLAVGAASEGPRWGRDTGAPLQYWIWWFNLVTGRTVQQPGAPSWDAYAFHLPVGTLHEQVGTAHKWWPKYVNGEIDYLGPDHALTDEDWTAFDIPTLIGVGWWDDQTTMANWLAVKDTPAGPESHLLIGAWDHVGNTAPRPELGGLDVSASVIDVMGYFEQFLARHLKPDLDTPPLPRCRVFRTGVMEWETPPDRSRMPLLRRGLVAALLAVANDLARDGMTLVVEDAFRTRAIQRGLAHVDEVVDGLIDVMARAEPALDVALVARRLATVVAGAPKTAGHMAGAAVDVSVLTEDGSDFDRGAPYLTVSEVMPMDSPFISVEAAANRRFVSEVMLRHGFAAYPYEFWHYCRDDALARVAAGDPTPARYGAIDLHGDAGGVVATSDPLAPLNPELELRMLIEGRFASRELRP